jgi:hypothetical protein
LSLSLANAGAAPVTSKVEASNATANRMMRAPVLLPPTRRSHRIDRFGKIVGH